MSRAHIILYGDEFEYDVWKQYCNACGAEPSAESIVIRFDMEDATYNYPEEEENEDE